MKPSAYISVTLTIALVSTSIAAAFPWMPTNTGLPAVDPLLDVSADLALDPMPAAPLDSGMGLADFVSAAASAAAAPIVAPDQIVQVPSVELGHRVVVQPETDVMPLSTYQPVLSIRPPIIYIDPFYTSLAGPGGYLGNYGSLGMLSNYGNGDLLYGSGPSGILMDPSSELAVGNPLKKRRVGSVAGALGTDPLSPSFGVADDGLVTDTIIQPIVNIETYSPAPVPVSNPIPYQYPVPYAVGTPFPVKANLNNFRFPFSFD